MPLPSHTPLKPIPENDWPGNQLGDPEKEAKLYLSVNILRAYKPEDEPRDKALRQVGSAPIGLFE